MNFGGKFCAKFWKFWEILEILDRTLIFCFDRWLPQVSEDEEVAEIKLILEPYGVTVQVVELTLKSKALYHERSLLKFKDMPDLKYHSFAQMTAQTQNSAFDYWVDEARGTKVLDLNAASLTYAITPNENAEMYQLCGVESSGSYGLIDDRGSMKMLDKRILSGLKELRPTVVKYRDTLESKGFVKDDDVDDVTESEQPLTDYVTKLSLMVTFLSESNGNIADSIFMFNQLGKLNELVQEFERATSLANNGYIEFYNQTCALTSNVKTECLVDIGDWKKMSFIPRPENGLVLGFDNVYFRDGGDKEECLSALDSSETVFQR